MPQSTSDRTYTCCSILVVLALRNRVWFAALNETLLESIGQRDELALFVKDCASRHSDPPAEVDNTEGGEWAACMKCENRRLTIE